MPEQTTQQRQAETISGAQSIKTENPERPADMPYATHKADEKTEARLNAMANDLRKTISGHKIWSSTLPRNFGVQMGTLRLRDETGLLKSDGTPLTPGELAKLVIDEHKKFSYFVQLKIENKNCIITKYNPERDEITVSFDTMQDFTPTSAKSVYRKRNAPVTETSENERVSYA